MLKENLRLIFKNRLTWIVLIIVLAVVVGFSLSKVVEEYREFYKYVYEDKYLVTKPFAVTAFSRCEDTYAAVILLTTPLCLSFAIHKNESFNNITTLRGNVLKQRIYKVLAIAIVTTIFFYIAYALGMLTFYFTMNPKMDHFAYLEHITHESSGYYNFTSDDYMLKSLLWMNKGNNSYIYYLVNGLIYSAVMFTMMLVIGSFSQLFPGHFQVIVFIIFIYVFLLGTSYLYDNTFDMAIFQPVGIIYEHNNYDGTLAKSFIYHPICNLCVTAIIYAIQYAIMRYKEKN